MIMKKTKILLLIITIIASTLTFGACGNTENSEVTESIIAKFMELTEIPRPSHHEKEVSDFLKSWAEGQDFEVVQDKANNLIIEVPATNGMEGKPLVILQGHTDMVFAQADGENLDPLTTKIEIVNDGKTLKSDGKTSIGADDGIGIAIMECIAEGMMEHGPLRLIFTTDEEDEMSGATALDTKYINDADYIINIDNENEGEILISSASGVNFEFSSKLTSQKASMDCGMKISLTGLTGGHSGLEIDKGRINGIIAMGEVLNCLKEEGINYELASIKAGSAANAIPTRVDATICVAQSDSVRVDEICSDIYENNFMKKHSETDPDMSIETNDSEIVKQVISTGDRDKILTFLSEKNNGVYTMSKVVDGLVESSTNLGIIDVSAKKFLANGLARSSDNKREAELVQMNKKLASKLGYNLDQQQTSKAWPAKKDNKLQELAVETYKNLFSEEPQVNAVHAGLECGYFAEGNPNANIISIGPTATDTHSIKECVDISTIGKVWSLIEGILTELN